MPASAAMAFFVGVSMIRNDVRSLFAATSAGIALSVRVASAAPESLNDRPTAATVDRMPVPSASVTFRIVVSPVPTVFRIRLAASFASRTHLTPDAIVAMIACDVRLMSVAPIRDSFAAAVTCSIAALPRNPADSTW